MLNVIDYIHTNRDRYVSELKQYLAIPSVSALPEHAGGRPARAPSGRPTRCGGSGSRTSV